MKTNTIISALIACIALVALQVKTEGQEDGGIMLACLPPSPVTENIGKDVGNDILTMRGVDQSELQIMSKTAENRIGEITFKDWSIDNGFAGNGFSDSKAPSGGYEFSVKITASGNFTVTSTGGVGVNVGVIVASGQVSMTAGVGISGEQTFTTSLQWSVRVPLKDGKPDMNAKLLLDYSYTYKGRTTGGAGIKMNVTLNQILAYAKALRDFEASVAAASAALSAGLGGGGGGGGGGGDAGNDLPPPVQFPPPPPKTKKATVKIGEAKVVEYIDKSSGE